MNASFLTSDSQVLTSSWSDGTAGPLAFTVPEGKLSAEAIKQFNEKHAGRAMVLTSGTSSHFMTGDTLVQVYEQLYSPALALQRAKTLKLNLLRAPSHWLTWKLP